ncbi:uncharacterized protein LOC115683525 isoform X2 [Syzygium oleosum]|uniref:uncharacterized protein LOC115683525 isoform X2 n=1 Tax=Syzygium oleosum TaxID=219896 RepID=UPI0011D26061|nr:uncharacterized protein LOC115683525 isoform X2 [Syzygium oleosum]
MARLPPLSLHKLLDEMPEGKRDEYVSDGTNCPRNPSFNDAWRSLCQQRWRLKLAMQKPVDWHDAYDGLFFQKGEDEAEEAALLRSLSGLRWQELLDQNQPADWHQAYCHTHLQNCLDEAAEALVRPSFDGKMGEIRISDHILEFLGCKGRTDTSTSKFSQLYQHCERFAPCLRNLKLREVLCVEETCHLLKNSRLESLALWGSRTRKHVRALRQLALRQLLLQNRETLTSLHFIHCQPPLPSVLSSFLSSTRCLHSLQFDNVQLDRNYADLIFTTLLDASCDLSVLDLCNNEISGCLSSFTWIYEGTGISSTEAAKPFASLRVLKLRRNDLHEQDAADLRHVLVHMPALRTLDLSENPIGDDGLRHLIPFLAEASGKSFSLAALSLEKCNLSASGVIELLNVLSTLDESLSSLSISNNKLGSHVAEALVKFMGTSVEVLKIGAVELGSSGFRQLQKVTHNKLLKIDMRENDGGIESAKFLSKLLECAPELLAVDAAYNIMPPESLPIICSALEAMTGNLVLLNLRGHNFDKLANDASVLVDLERDGRLRI